MPSYARGFVSITRVLLIRHSIELRVLILFESIVSPFSFFPSKSGGISFFGREYSLMGTVLEIGFGTGGSAVLEIEYQLGGE